MTSGAVPLADRLTIRPATAGELDRISDIINDPPNPGAVAIAGSPARAISAGRVLVRAGLSLDLASTVVAEIDGVVVGVMDAGARRHEVEVTPLLFLRLLPAVLRTTGPMGLWRLMRTRSAYARANFPVDTDSYYIAELDVDLAYRGWGIGGMLLDYGEAEARAAGVPRMSLVTDITNPAQHLYERRGFRIVETKRDAEFERWWKTPGRVRMVKELP